MINEQFFYNNSIAAALLDELTKLNSLISVNTNMTDLVKTSGLFIYGFNPAEKVDSETYKKNIAFIKAVTKVLEEFDINKRNNGYAYIIDAVMLIIDQKRLDIRLGDNVYPYIKSKYSLNSIAIVEHNIRNAIKSAYNRSLKGKTVSRMNKYDYKPTNKEFLITVTHDVCNRMYKELMHSTS